MNFHSAEQYILSLSNIPRREYMADPSHCSIYLKRLQFFLDILGNPEKKIRHYIHVTGTSGKGSVCSYLHSILLAADMKVGASFSPHPSTILERWKYRGKYMSENEFAEIVTIIKPKLDEYLRTSPYDMLSFFELVEAIGFVYFAQKNADWVVLEVGCGGRYDSSNVIPWKDAAIITNIGLDHVGLIGNTKEEIAYEKSGIIKRKCKVFTAETDAKIVEIFKDECLKQKAAFFNTDYHYNVLERSLLGSNFEYHGEKYELKVAGEHQIVNAILAINVTEQLGIGSKEIKKGLTAAQQPLRLEVVSKSPMIILDGAHNPDKMKTTVKTIQEIAGRSQIENIHLVVGFSGDKDVGKMINHLIKLKPTTIAITRNTTNPSREVKDPAALLQEFLKKKIETTFELFLDPADALAWSKSCADKQDLILVTGSIYLSGELRPSLV